MNTYQVHYTAWDNKKWQHSEEAQIVLASSPKEAKRMIEDRSNSDFEYTVTHIEEIEE